MAAVKCQPYGAASGPRMGGIKKEKNPNKPGVTSFLTPGELSPASQLCILGQGSQSSLQSLRSTGTKPGHTVWPPRCQSDSNPTPLTPRWPRAQGPGLAAPAHPELRMWHATEAVSISGWPSRDLDNCDNIWRAFHTFRALTYIIQVTLRFVTDQTGAQRTTVWPRPHSQQQHPGQNLLSELTDSHTPSSALFLFSRF